MFSLYYFLWYSQRSLSVAVMDNMRKAAESSCAEVVTESKIAEFGGAEAVTKQKEIFWMRDPKSGNWIPESHLDEVDVVDLREKFLPRQRKLT